MGSDRFVTANPHLHTELVGTLGLDLMLGVGDWRLLRMLGLHPVAIWNAGHAAFAALENGYRTSTTSWAGCLCGFVHFPSC